MENLHNSIPLVSVIIPVYNQEKYINECIDSCLDQSYSNIEIIVVDDGSNDHTPELIKAYGKKINYIRQENQGAAVALNKGIRQAKGEWVAWLSSDDVYLTNKILKQVEFFNVNPDFDICYTDWYSIDGEGIILQEVKSPWYPPSEFLSKLLLGNFINGTSILMKKNVWQDIGGFDESIPAVVDGEMWFRLLLKGYKFGQVPEVLVKYRTHPNNQSSNFLLMRRYMDIVSTKALGWFSYEALSFNSGSSRKDKYDFYFRLFNFFTKEYQFMAAYTSLLLAAKYEVVLSNYIRIILFYFLKSNQLFTIVHKIKKLLKVFFRFRHQTTKIKR